MTARDYLSHPEFVAFCALWEKDGRCPFPFGDWLRDRGLDAQGDAADWAANEPDREGFWYDSGGVRPFLEGAAWGSTNQKVCRSSVPEDVYQGIYLLGRETVRLSYPDAVAAMLDGWALVRPARVPA